jgi:Nucleotidyl transferase AbiEii toxin, Type IV TA system
VITGQPETADPLLPLAMPGLARPRYRLYPLVDSVADKVMAMSELHAGRPSTRFRDLVDLVLIARTQRIRADELRTALVSERLRRGLPVVDRLVVPDEALWRSGYKAVAADVADVPEKALDDALRLARRLVEPVLNGLVDGSVWDPLDLTWIEESPKRG